MFLVGLLLAVGWVSTATFVPVADATSAFSGLAESNGAQVSYQIQGFLIVDYIADLGATTAQASVDSLDSSGFAAEPYPGSTVLAGPGLALGSAPVPVAPPGYPLMAQSTASTPSSDVQQGPVDLHAESDQTSSSASAQAAAASSGGNTLGSSVSAAEVVYDTRSGAVTSKAQSDTQPSSFSGGVLVIGHTRATAESDGPGSGGPATLTSGFAADGVTVAGEAVSITPAGLTLKDSSIPLPPSDPINQALAAAHLKIQYVAPRRTGNEIESAGIVISQSEPIPNSPNPGVLTVAFGEALASAQGGADLASAPSSPSPLGGTGSFSGTGAAINSDSGAGAASMPVPALSGSGPAPASPPVGGSTPFQGPGSSPVGGSDSPSVAAAPSIGDTGSTGVRLGPTQRATLQYHQQFGAAFYLILVMAGVLAFGTIQFVRFFAVRLAWRS